MAGDGRDDLDRPGARESCCTDCTCSSIECSGSSVREDVLNPECPDGIMDRRWTEKMDGEAERSPVARAMRWEC